MSSEATLVRAGPTLADAQRAADALEAAGVPVVLLFGSVARGDADEDSDIDLIAIYDDLGNYTGRHDKQKILQEAASAASGWRCEVDVTDRPEWKHRSERVSSSFEFNIGPHAVALVNLPPSTSINWGKKIGRPVNNHQEALRHLRDRVHTRLDELFAHMRPSHREERHSDPAVRELSRLRRMVSLCEDSSMAVELALKAIIVLQGVHPISEKELKKAGHDINKCLNQVRPPQKQRLEQAVRTFGLDLSQMSQWRWRATYPADIDIERANADQTAPQHVRTAITVAEIVADELETACGPHQDINRCRDLLADMRHHYNTTNLRTGNPLQP